MPTDKAYSFDLSLNKFSKSLNKDKTGAHPKLILIMMANTHDPEIARGCKKDVKAVRKVFKHICKHTDYCYFEIEISGNNYTRKNLLAAIDCIEPFNKDVTIFYYSGHGFSYEKDTRRKYPQIDLRAFNNNKKYNNIDFINKYTENLTVILQLMRMRGGRVNIAIADCCNSNVPYKRGKESHVEMGIAANLMPPVNKKMTKKLFTDEQHTVSILVSSSQRGQFSISDPKIGSIFTHYFTRALSRVLSRKPEEGQYLPWRQLLDKTASQTFHLSKSYDIGGGKPGHQQAIFEILIEDERNL
jgi:hypothetical protein